MPKYFYRCRNCNVEVYFFHSMSEKREDCKMCETSDSLEKIPTQFTTNHNFQEEKTGDVVKRKIEEFKVDLEEQKENLSNEFYSSNK